MVIIFIMKNVFFCFFIGYYISDVFDVEKRCWYSFDDFRVFKIIELEIRFSRERSGYIFFYFNK